MSKKIIWILVVMLAAVLLLSACVRSAVAPKSQATATETSGGQITVALPDVYKTQTAAGTITMLVLTMQPGVPSTVSTGDTPTPTATLMGGATSLPPTNTPIPTTGGGNPGAPTPTAGRPATYTLQEGEFPYCIARRLNINPDELLALNGLGDGQVFQPGLVLNIPQTGNTFPGARDLHAHPTSYTVQADDTIYKIACYFGDVDPIYLAAYNGIAAQYALQSGTVLNIP